MLDDRKAYCHSGNFRNSVSTIMVWAGYLYWISEMSHMKLVRDDRKKILGLC